MSGDIYLEQEGSSYVLSYKAEEIITKNYEEEEDGFDDLIVEKFKEQNDED